MTLARALIFDMDGVLIDSEPLWRRAERACFGEVGLALTDDDCLQTQGLRIDEAVAYWYDRAPWPDKSIPEVATHIVERMGELIRKEARPMAGVRPALASALAAGWRLALASSSSADLIETVLDALALRDAFEVVRSAEHEARGKPAPDVYLSTARDLDLAPADCVAVEDSVHGVASAIAAGMRCVAVPPRETRGDPRFEIATWRLDSLDQLPQALSEIDRERNERSRQ